MINWLRGCRPLPVWEILEPSLNRLEVWKIFSIGITTGLHSGFIENPLTFCFNSQFSNLSKQGWIKDFPEGHQHKRHQGQKAIIHPNFSENCMKIKKIRPGVASKFVEIDLQTADRKTFLEGVDQAGIFR